ncbi:unnamed protein product [Arctogadus glacialis]
MLILNLLHQSRCLCGSSGVWKTTGAKQRERLSPLRTEENTTVTAIVRPALTGPGLHWPLRPLAPQTTGPSAHWTLSPLAPQSTGPSAHWTLSPLDPQTFGPLGHWPLRPLAPQTTGPSGHWPLRSLAPQTFGPSDHWPLRSLAPQTTGPSGHWPLRSLAPQTCGPQTIGNRWCSEQAPRFARERELMPARMCHGMPGSAMLTTCQSLNGGHDLQSPPMCDEALACVQPCTDRGRWRAVADRQLLQCCGRLSQTGGLRGSSGNLHRDGSKWTPNPRPQHADNGCS